MPRSRPEILHLDMDAFFASVEQRDKPSLRGRPVAVGGTGPRGVVAAASYEARTFGVRSAMGVADARRRCPSLVVLTPRFTAYRAVSAVVHEVLAARSPTVEPLSLDEAFLDLADGPAADLSTPAVRGLAAELRADVLARTGLPSSVGAATSKLVAKIATDLAKPDGALVVAPGEEAALLGPLPVGVLWGVGPVTRRTLGALGVRTVADLLPLSEADLVRDLGAAAGAALFRLARAQDDRPVEPDREAKSIGAEETFPTDVVDARRLVTELERLLARVTARLRETGLAARTVTVKVRLHDFETLTRAHTADAATDDPAVHGRAARALLAGLDTRDGVRLLGVSLAGFQSWSQAELPWEPAAPAREAGREGPIAPVSERVEPRVAAREQLALAPGCDVVHDVHGRGWVQGLGLGRVTLRLETAADTRPGRTVTVAVDDPALHVVEPS